MNRYSDLSTSTYKPLSLQEIMMVPTIKQKQHDEAQAMADEYSALSSNRLAQDAELVDARLGELRGKADAITNSLLEKGVDRDTIGQLNKLKREKELEFSQQGLIGNAQSNYTGAMSYVKDLAEKKERQAGWSAAEAKAWAQRQVMEFQGTKNEDGSFNAFSGRELEDYENERAWIDDSLKMVMADEYPTGLKFSKNIAQFTAAWQSGQVEDLDYYKVVNALAGRAQNDPKLQASLIQKGLMTGEKNANSVGKMMIDPKTKKQYFQPTSSFGAQLEAAASGYSHKNVKANWHFNTDTTAQQLYFRGLDKADAELLTIATTQQLSTVEPKSYEELSKLLDLGESEINNSKTQVDKIYNELIKSGVSPDDAKKDAGFLSAQSGHNDAKTRYSNAKRSLGNIQKAAYENISVSDKEQLETSNKLKEILDFANSTYKRGGDNRNNMLNAMAKFGISREDYIAATKGSIGLDQNSVLMTAIYKKKFGKERLFGVDDYKDGLNIYENVKKKAAEHIKMNPYSQDYISFSNNVTGEYKSKITAINEGLTNKFNLSGGQGWVTSESNTNVSSILKDYPRDTYDRNIEVGNGMGNDGYSIETLVIKDKKGTKVESFPLTRGIDSNKTQYEAGKTLMDHPMYGDKGRAMVQGYDLIPKLKKMDISKASFTEGVIPGEENNDGTVILVKRYPSGRYTLTNVRREKNSKDEYIKVGEESGSLGGIENIVETLNPVR